LSWLFLFNKKYELERNYASDASRLGFGIKHFPTSNAVDARAREIFP
jgi:hypothetical protein